MLLYSEMAYFDGYAFAHIAAWQDHKRLRARMAACKSHFERNRANRPLRSCA